MDDDARALSRGIVHISFNHAISSTDIGANARLRTSASLAGQLSIPSATALLLASSLLILLMICFIMPLRATVTRNVLLACDYFARKTAKIHGCQNLTFGEATYPSR